METAHRTVTIARRRFDLRRDVVERLARHVPPEPISSHYVVIGRRRYPPKQVIGLVTGLDRADFTSHQARRVLMGLGFAAGRLHPSVSSEREGATPAAAVSASVGSRSGRAVSRADRDRALAETLRPLRGEWVAVKDGELLAAAATPKELVGWLARYGRRADSMFRVPEDEIALGGLAPL